MHLRRNSVAFAARVTVANVTAVVAADSKVAAAFVAGMVGAVVVRLGALGSVSPGVRNIEITFVARMMSTMAMKLAAHRTGAPGISNIAPAVLGRMVGTVFFGLFVTFMLSINLVVATSSPGRTSNSFPRNCRKA